MYHDDATERAIILDRTAIHLAVSQTMNQTGTGILMSLSPSTGTVSYMYDFKKQQY